MPKEGIRVRDPKRRIIRVRLSEWEYQRLQGRALKTGRNLSEIIRAALRQFLQEGE